MISPPGTLENLNSCSNHEVGRCSPAEPYSGPLLQPRGVELLPFTDFPELYPGMLWVLQSSYLGVLLASPHVS